MPKKIPKQELEAILAIVVNHPDGVQVKTIRDGLKFGLPPRMLQRRLALLIKQKRLIVKGRGRGSRYGLPGITGEAHIVSGGDKMQGLGEVYVPVSPEGVFIKQAVRKPLQNRRPVGYNRAFLDDCRIIGNILTHREIQTNST